MSTSRPDPSRPRQAPGPQEPPRVFGDYELLAPLAEGGMGSIHLARRRSERPTLQPFCVVKRLRRELARQSSFLRRFEDEARVVVTLRHPALCHVFDVGRVDDEHYLAMELVEGVSLRELAVAAVAAGERIDAGCALAIVDDVLDALGYAHELCDAASGAPLRIVHRDVSPQNVLVTAQGGVKLIDFGVVASTLRSERTTGGLIVGKLAYMAPEQARGDPVDARADVYAVAIVLWELLAGRRFYGERSKAMITLLATEGTFVPAVDDLPEALRAPLLHALAPEPADRTPSATQFASELAAAAQQAGLPRASHRDVRALVTRLCAGELAGLQRRLNDARGQRVTLPRERTVVTTIARSRSAPDDEAGVTTASAPLEHPPVHAQERPGARDHPDDDRLATEPTRILTPASSASPGRRGRRAAAAFGVAFALALAAVVALRSPPSPSSSPSSSPPPSSPSPSSSLPAPLPAMLSPTALPSPAEASAPPAGARKATERSPMKREGLRPPEEPLPNLGATLDYLARWCTARTPCASSLIAARGRIALLDVAGLRALRTDAARCVEVCRRP